MNLMSGENLQNLLEKMQAEFRQDAEALAMLQNIYADKVKQLRTNRAFPPDIQERFLLEWEQFYNHRVAEIIGPLTTITDSVNENQ
jgi:hypothetical protein